jgi:hypothetical protein
MNETKPKKQSYSANHLQKETRFILLYSFFFGCISFFLLTQPIKMAQAESSETSPYKIQKPGVHPKERIQHSEQGESFKSKNGSLFSRIYIYKHVSQ